MKKLAIGCGVVLVIGMIAGAGVGYYVYRKAQALYTEVAQLGQLPEIERGVKARGEYAPPSSGELTKTQIERLVRVQSSVRQRLGQDFAAMEKKYKTLADKDNANITDVPALMAAYRDLASAWIAAKRSQVDALNEAGLSLHEYRWIREQAYRALGVTLHGLRRGHDRRPHPERQQRIDRARADRRQHRAWRAGIEPEADRAVPEAARR